MSGLNIRRLKESETVGSNTKAEFRVMRTVDGELVRESDPRAAFLAYTVGMDVADADADGYRSLAGTSGAGGSEMDDFDRRALEFAKQEPAARGDRGRTIGEREATALADRAREIANAPQKQRVEALADASDKPVAQAPIYRTEDGTMSYDNSSGDAVQVYAPGDVIADGDADAVKELGDAPKQDDDDTTKQQPPAANKAVTRSRTSNK